MGKSIKNITLIWLSNKIKEFILSCFDKYAIKSYSQEGEDMILRRIFENVENGFYVDVGAHHPKRFSNTFYFYKKGWSGINIDAMPGSMSLFNKIRPRDINIEAAVSNEKEEVIFYIFNEVALNTFDSKLVLERTNNDYYVVKKQKIVTKELKEILWNILPKNKKIHFMSIDVEGFDLKVVQSNNWELFRPEYLLVEHYGSNMNEIQNSDLYKFIIGKNYELYAKSVLTVFFKDKSNYLK